MFKQNKKFELEELSKKEVQEIINKKFVIALDFDGVITSPYKLKAQYLHELNSKVSPFKCNREDCINLGIKEEDYERQSIKAYTQSPDKLPLEDGFIENYSKIRESGEIATFIVTSRYDFMLKHFEDCLKYHQISFDGVINTNRKSKLIGLEKISANIFVDDDISKINEIINEDERISEKCQLILYKNIHNKHKGAINSKIKEIYGWNNLSKEIFKNISLEYKSLNRF